MVSLVAVDHDVVLTTDAIEALSQLPVASVCNVQVCVDEVNECDDNCKVNDDDVLRPVHTVDDGELCASDVKDVCEVGCEVVVDDNVDDNLGRVHTVDGMTDECEIGRAHV